MHSMGAQCLSTLHACNTAMCNLKPCTEDICQFCHRLDQVRNLEKVAQWLATDPVKVTINGYYYGELCMVEWPGMTGDKNAELQVFVMCFYSILTSAILILDR